MTEIELKGEELKLRRQELEVQQTQLFIEFAKFGFKGTLTGAIVGMALVLALACLNAFTTFKIETSGLVFIMLILVVGVVLFGYLSLWQAPNIVARWRDKQVIVGQSTRQQKVEGCGEKPIA